MLGWQTQGITNEKDYATLQVIDSLLGSGMSSRMFKFEKKKDLPISSDQDCRLTIEKQFCIIYRNKPRNFR